MTDVIIVLSVTSLNICRIYFKTWIYYTKVSDNEPISSSSFSTSTISTQTKDMSLLSTNTDKGVSEPHLTTNLLSDIGVITSSVQFTTEIDNTDEFNSNDFISTSKDSRITKSFKTSTFFDLSTTQVPMSTQFVQKSFDYTSSIPNETMDKVSSSASSSTNHLVLYSNILSNHVTSKLVSTKFTTAKQVHSDSTINQEKMSSTFISDHSILDVNSSSTNSLSLNKADSGKVSLASLASSSIQDDRYASSFSMINNSPYSKHSFGSVILQSSTHELKSRALTESSLQTILPSSQKFSTNSLDRISTLIVSVSSPHHTIIYSSSLRSTKAATIPPKMVITTSSIVLPRRTTPTVSQMISTSNNDPTTGMNYLYFTTNTTSSYF